MTKKNRTFTITVPKPDLKIMKDSFPNDNPGDAVLKTLWLGLDVIEDDGKKKIGFSGPDR